MTIGHSDWGVTGHYEQWLAQKGIVKGKHMPQLQVKRLFPGDAYGTEDWGMPVECHSGQWIVERTEAFLREAPKDRPFFLNLGFQDPHHPLAVPKDFPKLPLETMPHAQGSYDPALQHIDALAQGEIENSRFSGPFGIAGNQNTRWLAYTEEQKQVIRQYYYTMVALYDQQIGQLMEVFKKYGAYENTLFLVTTDHGDMLFDHGIGEKGPLYYSRQCREMAERAASPRKEELLSMAENLGWISCRPPETFWQAAQLSWLYSILAHTLDYGRMDDYLGPFLAKDLQNGVLSEEMAQRIIDNIWLLIADKRTTVHGRVMLGGKGRRDPKSADVFLHFAMEATHHVRRNEPQLSLRWYEGMDPEILHHAMQLLGEGTTFPILYNDDINIPNVQKAFTVPEEEAEQYYPFGCGEYVIGGKSFGSPNGVLNVARVLELTLHNGCDPETGKQVAPSYGKDFSTFESLYQAYLQTAEHYIRFLAKQEAAEYKAAGKMAPFLFLSLLYDDCIQRGKGMFNGGIRYLGGTLECYGNITTSDSLCAIEKLVYEDMVHPENYQNLFVRVGGYSGRFISLPREVQLDIISRTAYDER